MEIRRIEQDGSEICLEIFLRASDPLEERRGHPPIDPDEVPWLAASVAHFTRTDPERAVFAIEDGKPIAFGAAIRRQSFWFLSFLEVVPEHQGKGVGRTLLEYLLPPEQERGSMTLATVVESAQPISTMLYARYGIVPRVPLFFMDHIRFVELPVLPAGVVSRQLSVEEDRDRIDRLDMELLGYARPQDHSMWFRDADLATVYTEGDRLLGYAYLTEEDVWIGPAIAPDENLLAAIVRDVGGRLGDKAPEATVPVFATAVSLLPKLLRGGGRSEEGAKLLYCSTGDAPPGHYLPYAGHLP